MAFLSTQQQFMGPGTSLVEDPFDLLLEIGTP